MSPTTRPLGDNFPSVEIETAQGGSTSSRVEQHINTPLPYLWFNGVMAALALGLSICSMVVTLVVSARSTVSENHWRDIETRQKILAVQLENLEKENERSGN